MAQRYDTYKDSGVQWLGEIPGHWKVVRNKWLFKEEDEKNTDLSYQLLSFSRHKGIIPFSENTDKEPSASDLSKYKVIRKGQLLENRMQAWSGMFGCSYIEGCVSPDYSVFSPMNGADTEYYAHLYRTPLYVQQFANASKGIGDGFNRLYTPQFHKIYAIYPPLPEQHAIVSYLDEKCGKIDEWLEKKQKEVELLGEMKQRVIADAVTRGLNPNVTMKQTNIPWLPEVPNNWEMVRVKALFENIREKNNPIQTEERLSLSIDKGVTLYSEKTTNLDRFKEDCTQYLLARQNDIVLNSMNMIVGAVGKSKYFGCVSPAYYVIRLRDLQNQIDYYSLLLNIQKIRDVYRILGKGIMAIDRGDGKVNTCRLKVPYDDFGAIKVPVPPIEEQKQIVDYITVKTSKIDKLLANINKEIEGIKEYKQKLISDVVTGQIKVINNN